MNTNSLLSILELKDFISFDVETTGLNSNSDSIIEFSAYRFINGKPEKAYTTLINPLREIPPFITELTGINNNHVIDSPTIQETLPELLDFFGNSPIVGQNIGFDLAFLNNSLKKK